MREEILSVLRGASDMTISMRPDGYPQATMVSYVSDGLTMYFGCTAESQKVQNIAYNNKVSLTVTCPTSTRRKSVACPRVAGRTQ
jgi:nitroimidazol reductase NimA-like FMN-containing flavoprotein (pyridoxamine 5'-phosphate oxidase superfamily)